MDTASTKSTARAAYRRLHAAMNSGDAEEIARALEEVAEPDMTFHAPVPEGLSAVQAVTRAWSMLFTAFPDIRVVLEDEIAEGDRIAYRQTVTGTHLGEYFGHPPTGRSVEYREMFVVRFSPAGRIAEMWGVVDIHGVYRQLGLLDA